MQGRKVKLFYAYMHANSSVIKTMISGRDHTIHEGVCLGQVILCTRQGRDCIEIRAFCISWLQAMILKYTANLWRQALLLSILDIQGVSKKRFQLVNVF